MPDLSAMSSGVGLRLRYQTLALPAGELKGASASARMAVDDKDAE